MKRNMLILLILLLAASVALAWAARQEQMLPAADATATPAVTTMTDLPAAEPEATPEAVG